MTVHPIAPTKVAVDQDSAAAYRALIQQIVAFRNARGWDEAQSPVNLAKSLSIEASEVLQCFQWADTLPKEDVPHLAEELADVLTYSFYLCDRFNLDPLKLVAAKNAINDHREW
ncbi:nucleotide pyrophosphohydrolase [Lacticaseibacillus parakribbianus]|uniref:nucleotide pyrophosphohydrolase n=1 Tax=Lacticaseibacillus parakribbianus TaxID=2970927 RepID=UPI0021CB16D2|nr:nucleotide pyrophosphohydrolase [Lacticaseibacillus parakribbianus]